MNKKRKKSNFLKNLLTTASIASVIVGASNTAFGAAVAPDGRITNANANIDDLAATGHWHKINDDGTAHADDADGPGVGVDGKAFMFGNAAHVVTVNNASTVRAISAGGLAVANPIQLNANFTTGSIVDVVGNVAANNTINFVFGNANNALTFTLTGENAVAANHGFNAAENTYTALGEVSFVAAGGANLAHTRTLVIKPTNPGDIVFTKFKVVNGANATLDITNVGHKVTFKHSEVATARTININGNTTVEFDSTGAGGALELQQADGDVINFGDDGSGTLLLTSRVVGAANATNFKVMKGSLGGTKVTKDGRYTPTDDYGVISFNTNAAAGILGSEVAAGAAVRAVIGHDETHRAKKFIVTAGVGAVAGNNNATIKGHVYTKALELNGGNIEFKNIVFVGDDGTTKFSANQSKITFNDNVNLGKVDFVNKADSTIKVADGKTLKGNFSGDRTTNSANKQGTISFTGNGIFEGSTERVNIIENTAAGTLRLSGTHQAEVQASAAGSHLEFADGYKLTGNINKTVAAGVTPNLTFLGSAEINGTIGFNGDQAVGDINITKKEGVVKLTTDVIKANNIFSKAGGGTLALIKQNGNVTITSRISADGGGTIDASQMTVNNTLTINGDIGTNPADNNSKALDQIILREQNIIFVPNAVANGVPGVVNVAGINFNKKSSTVQLSVPGANYALGTLENAESAIVEISQNISLYNTKTADKGLLKEIKFVGDKILTLHHGDDITTSFITTQDVNAGTLVFAGNSTLKGPIGTANRKLKEIKVLEDVEATTSGVAYLNGDVTLSNRSVLNVDNDYHIGRVVSNDTAGAGTLRFVNKGQAQLETAQVQRAGNAGHAIDTLELNGGSVKLVNNGISFKNIKFTTKDKVILTLDKDMQLAGVNVQSSAAERPTIQLTNVKGDKITGNQSVGDKDHFIDLQFIGNTTLDVQSQDAFVAVSTAVSNTGIVNFDVGAANNLVIAALGSENLNLKEANFKSNTENLGSTHAEKATVYDGMAYTASGTVAGGAFYVGNAKGGATVNFNNGIILKDNLVNVGTNNKVNFAGNAAIYANIGASGNKFEEITFNGDKSATAILACESLNAKKANFGSENIKVAASEVTLDAVSHINANIDLDSNILGLKEGGTWGTNTSIKTTLTREGKLGYIRLGDTVSVAGDVPVKVHVVDEASLKDHRNGAFTLIDGAKFLELKNGKIILDDMPTTDRVYIRWVVAVKDGKQVITREVNEREGMKADLKKHRNDPTDEQNVDVLVAALEGDAKDVADDLSFIQDQKKRVEFMERLFNSENDKVTEHIGKDLGNVVNMIGKRINVTRQVSAGSDDDSTSMGAWVMPYYGQAVQDKQGGSVGYTSRSVGGVFGFDTLANENLTVGAAVGVIESSMKFKDYKNGEKATISTFMGSIYGSQQLDKDFFIQAVASFASSKVSNTDPRIVSSKTNTTGQETAKASYNSTSYGGELLLGYNAKVADSVLLTPTAGIRYTRFNDEGYKETGTKSQNKIVGSKESNVVEAIIGARLSTTIDTSGVAVMPEVHAFVSQKLGNKAGKVNAKLSGITDPFVTRADESAKTLCNVGLGISAKAGSMEYGAGYDAYLANKYVGHQGTLKVRINF